MTNSNLELLKNLAASTVSQYPQYAGHFAGYEMCRVKRDVRTKMGLAFRKGEIVIGKRGADHAEFLTLWSYSNRIDTSVRARDVEWF